MQLGLILMTRKQLGELPGISPGPVLGPGFKPIVSGSLPSQWGALSCFLSQEACRVQRECASLAVGNDATLRRLRAQPAREEGTAC